MDEKDWIVALSEQNQLQKVMEMNKKTEGFGLLLTEEDAKLLVKKRKETLKEAQRVEFGEGILAKLIYTFCDSAYIVQDNYVDTIVRLQEIFYLYKNESLDELTDDELLEFMKEAFEGECEGCVELLEGTVLEEFARNIRKEGNSFFGKGCKLSKLRRRDETDELL